MRKVVISKTVQVKIAELDRYLTQNFHLSKSAANVRIGRMQEFVASLGNEADYPLCRFKKWRALDYRCAVFEKDWVFAYKVLPEGGSSATCRTPRSLRVRRLRLAYFPHLIQYLCNKYKKL